ncbi:MAG: hemolysin family protein [Gemmatimonadales bacterium]
MLGLLAVFALVLANAFFVSAEFALVGARRTRLEQLARAGDRKAMLASRAIQSLDRYISATQLGITLASLGLGWIGEPAVAGLIEGAFKGLPAAVQPYATHFVAIAIAFAFITMLHIVLGELAPKAVALLYPETVSGVVVVPLMGFSWLMHWPIKVLNGLANLSLRVFRIRAPTAAERVHSPEEVRMLVEQMQESGQLPTEDARMLEGVFEFSEKTAEEVMTPRTDIVSLPDDVTAEIAADVAADAKKSRYPVYHDTLDEIVGIIHTKDLLHAVRQRPGTQVKTLMRPPLFVPGTREVEDVLVDMKRMKTHMAVVLDEYGGTAGVVTMEDLLEEIVGPLEDEFDVAQRAEPPQGVALLDGALPVGDFNADYDENLSDADYTTIGGWIFGQIGRLPRVGDRVTAGKHQLEVAEMEGRRVKAIRVV